MGRSDNPEIVFVSELYGLCSIGAFVDVTSLPLRLVNMLSYYAYQVAKKAERRVG